MILNTTPEVVINGLSELLPLPWGLIKGYSQGIKMTFKKNSSLIFVCQLSLSYHRTSKPCSRKFFRLGNVCCRSGVVKPCWYLSWNLKKTKQHINHKQHITVFWHELPPTEGELSTFLHLDTVFLLTSDYYFSGYTIGHRELITAIWGTEAKV